MQQEDRKAYFSRIGKLGAAALNSDPVKKKASVLKGAQTRRKKAETLKTFADSYAKLELQQEKRPRS